MKYAGRADGRLQKKDRKSGGRFEKLQEKAYQATEGEILLNGIDIRKYRYAEYMDIFSVVFQDFQLFAQPIGANVASGTKYDSERVLDVLGKAGFAERLAELPDGMQTYAYKDYDEDGVNISGGEAQYYVDSE